MPPFIYASADFGFWDALVALSLGDEHELPGSESDVSQAPSEVLSAPSFGEIEAHTSET